MVNLDFLRKNIYEFFSTYSNNLVLYDESGTRVYDIDAEFTKIWANDLRMFVRIESTTDDTTIILSIVGNRDFMKLKPFIQSMREMAVSNNVLLSIEVISTGTPASISNPLKTESWQPINVSKVLKRIPVLSRIHAPKSNGILTQYHDPNGTLSTDSIGATNTSLLGILTSTTASLSNIFDAN